MDSAYEMVRKSGIKVLSARNLASELGTSTAPIFTAFKSIAELKALVVERAKNLYKTEYLDRGLKHTLPFKGVGLNYVRFAKDEPELFKLLFMQSDGSAEATHYLPSGDENGNMILTVVENSYQINEDKAKNLYNHLSIYTHGLAVLFAQRINIFTMEDVSRLLTEAFTAFKLINEQGDGNDDS